jgi:hypothetical protein
MARVKQLAGRVIEQHTSPNHGGTMSAHRGVVLHIAQGSYRGTIGWQMNPNQRYADGTRVTTSSTWVVGKEPGEWAQMVDTDAVAWTQRDGSRTWLSIELAGFAPAKPTAWQVEACAQLLAWSARVYGHPIAIADHPGERGLGHHAMDREWLGENWGHDECPGSGVIGAKAAIVKRAKQIADGSEDDDVDPKDRLKVPAWVMEEYPEIGGSNRGTMTAETAWASGYGHSRLGKDRITKYGKEILAGQAAILAKLGGQDVTAAVRAELDKAAQRERAERRAELGELQDLLAEASRERAELAELVGRAQSGELNATEVVDEIGRRLGTATDAGDTEG